MREINKVVDLFLVNSAKLRLLIIGRDFENRLRYPSPCRQVGSKCSASVRNYAVVNDPALGNVVANCVRRSRQPSSRRLLNYLKAIAPKADVLMPEF